MFDTTTPFHEIYTSMACSCAQCQQTRNAPTTILPRLDKLASASVVITEIFTAINAETGARVTYHWPIRRKY